MEFYVKMKNEGFGGKQTFCPGSEFHTKVVGVTKRNDEEKSIQSILKEMQENDCEGEIVELEHEEDNRYDENAIKVIHDGNHIGYINRELAAEIVGFVDAGMVDAEISDLTGGEDGKTRGCNLLIQINEENPVPIPSHSRNRQETKVIPKHENIPVKRKKSRGKIVFLCILCLIAVLVLLSVVQSSRKEESESEQPRPLQPTSSEDRQMKDALVDNARQCLEAFYTAEEVQNVSVQEIKIEADILYADSVDSVPADWDSVQATAQEASTSLQSVASADGIQYGVIYLVDGQGNNLLTAMNGKISYDSFAEVVEYAGSNPPTINLEEFNAIQEGMTYQEVTDIVGSSGELVSESGMSGSDYYTQLRSWEGEGSLGANANVMFQGGVVVSKSQFGLQ